MIINKLVRLASLMALISINISTLSVYASDEKVIERIAPMAAENLDEYFKKLGEHNRFIGSIGYYQHGKKVYQNATTLKNNQITSTQETLKYRVGSISKTFTSVMVLQLIEEKKLSLDTTLDSFYPKIENAKVITIAQMLNHHSGIKSFTSDPNFMNIYLTPQSAETIVGMIEGYDSLFKPGSKGEYSNSNYYLLGQIIEKLTNQTYQQNLTSRITKKLGLTDTFYGGKISVNKNEVNSYYLDAEQWMISAESDMSVPHGAGAIVSTTVDLNRFAFGLFNGELISEASLQEMLVVENGYAKGVFKKEFKHIDSYTHGGAIDHFRSVLVYQPSTQKSITVLSNGLEMDLGLMVDAVLTASEGGSVSIPNFKTIEVSVDKLSQFTGVYASDTHPLDIKLFIENDELLAQATGQNAIKLSATSETSFTFLKAGISIEFDKEKPTFVIYQKGEADEFTRVRRTTNQAISVSIPQLKKYEGVYKSPTFPLDIKVFLDGKSLMAQATGQGAFPLTAVSQSAFKFSQAGIVIKFDSQKNQLVLSQGGNDTAMTKS